MLGHPEALVAEMFDGDGQLRGFRQCSRRSGPGGHSGQVENRKRHHGGFNTTIPPALPQGGESADQTPELLTVLHDRDVMRDDGIEVTGFPNHAQP
jgi:hypothetical protein